MSESVTIHGGEPQWSKTGPVAFIVHINRLPSVLASSPEKNGDEEAGGNEDDDDVALFADDTTISEIIDAKNHTSGDDIDNATRNMVSYEVY